jgi:hypothetical protein
MVAVNAMRTMFNRIGFTIAASQIIIDKQGLDSLDEIRLLTDDEIENLCKTVRCPGGKIPGPNPGDPPVNNPGTPVNLRAENHSKLLAFCLRHQERVSRRAAAANITLHTIHAFPELRDFELSYKPPDDPPAINAKDWPKTMESPHKCLCSYLGDRRIPLAYVVRKDEAVPVDDPAGQYATVRDGTITRARHFTIEADGTQIIDAVYLTNRKKVYEIIAKITRDHPCWSNVKPA